MVKRVQQGSKPAQAAPNRAEVDPLAPLTHEPTAILPPASPDAIDARSVWQHVPTRAPALLREPTPHAHASRQRQSAPPVAEALGPKPWRPRPRSGPTARGDRVAPRVERLISGPPANQLDVAAAFAELKRIGVPFTKARSLGIADAVRLDMPILGVELPYVHRPRRDRPTKLLRRDVMTFDVRYVVALAHTIQHIQAWGARDGFRLVQINQIGGHTTHTNEGALRTKGGHPRGLALDLHSFVLADDNGNERTLSLERDWVTARSSSESGDRVVVQTAEEVARMTPNERWLRQLWGFLETEFDFVRTPSHNQPHWDHFHPEVLPTRKQRAQEDESFARYRQQTSGPLPPPPPDAPPKPHTRGSA